MYTFAATKRLNFKALLEFNATSTQRFGYTR